MKENYEFKLKTTSESNESIKKLYTNELYSVLEIEYKGKSGIKS